MIDGSKNKSDCYISWNGYDKSYEAVHEGAHLPADCPDMKRLQREMWEIEHDC